MRQPKYVTPENKTLLPARQAEEPHLVDLDSGMQPGASLPKSSFKAPARVTACTR
jgi:hypothetical protein